MKSHLGAQGKGDVRHNKVKSAESVNADPMNRRLQESKRASKCPKKHLEVRGQLLYV